MSAFEIISAATLANVCGCPRFLAIFEICACSLAGIRMYATTRSSCLDFFVLLTAVDSERLCKITQGSLAVSEYLGDRDVPISGHDHVIDHWNPEQISARLQALGQLEVLGARRRI